MKSKRLLCRRGRAACVRSSALPLPQVFSVDVDTLPIDFRDLFRIGIQCEISDDGNPGRTTAYIYGYIIRLFSPLATPGSRGENHCVDASRCTLCTEIVVKLKSYI